MITHSELLSCVGIFHSFEMILDSFNVRNYEITSPEAGEIVIVSEKPIPQEAIDWLEAYRPIGAVLTLKIAEKPCYCFGPPSKDCPIHGS